MEPCPARGRPKPITLARPGHADLAGAIKYDTTDIRDVLERASARSTAPRVLAGAVCAPAAGRRRGRASGASSTSSGPIRAFRRRETRRRAFPTAGPSATASSPHRCAARTRCRGAHDAPRWTRSSRRATRSAAASWWWRRACRSGWARTPSGTRGSTRALAGGGHGHPGGQGRRRSGSAFGVARTARAARSTTRSTRQPPTGRGGRTAPAASRAACSNGVPIVVRAAVKPVATLRKPLDSVDLVTGAAGPCPHRAQ